MSDTNKDQLLTERLIAVEGWNFEPGMIDSDGDEIESVDGDDVFVRGLKSAFKRDEIILDFLDDATQGEILAQLSRVYGFGVTANRTIMACGPFWRITDIVGDVRGFGSTIGEALVHAVERAPWSVAKPEPEAEIGGGTLTLRRRGTFVLTVRRGSQHCGIVDPGSGPTAPVHCSYSLEIVCASDCLDSSGFLVEQAGVHAFFRELPATSLSCEKLVIKLSRDLYAKIMAENPGCVIHAMSLEISPETPDPSGQASVMYGWQPQRDQ